MGQNSYINQLGGNLHELRLTFLWPLRPNGKLGTGRQTYRALVAGQIMRTNSSARRFIFTSRNLSPTRREDRN